MMLLLTIATISSPKIARSFLPLPCGPKVTIILTRRAGGGHTSSTFSGARTVNSATWNYFFTLDATWLSSVTHVPYPKVRRFTAPLYKFIFFLLGHFRPRRLPSLICKFLLAIHNFLSSSPPNYESCAIVDATSPIDQAQHAGILHGRRGSWSGGVGKIQNFHSRRQHAEEAGDQQETQSIVLPQ